MAIVPKIWPVRRGCHRMNRMSPQVPLTCQVALGRTRERDTLNGHLFLSSLDAIVMVVVARFEVLKG